ncbi:unnamed protein product [Brassicogethes aeneus]|uniref:Uncharacterized protein n=1 Tax=Brassicogethes aeneus TaxID=1431903 RepID=A0A9P0B0K0_BRAAE|nr:unnamed protein product [Brassicogethes aeneus]
MSLSEQQVADYYHKISDILSKKRETANNEQILLSFCEIHLKDLEMARANEIAAEKALNDLTSSESLTVNKKFVELKESYDNLKEKYENTLKDNETQKRNYENHIQMIIASNTMILDEKETIYKQQLVEINNKIRFLQNSNRELHLKLNNSRQNQPKTFNVVKQSNVLNFQSKPSNIQNNFESSNLNYFEDLDLANQETDDVDDFALLHNFKKSTNTANRQKDTVNNNKSQKCTGNTQNASDTDSTIILGDLVKKNPVSNNSAIQRKPTIYGGYRRKNSCNDLPPLEPCTNSNNNYVPKKKRKIFDPDQMNYLDLFKD